MTPTDGLLGIAGLTPLTTQNAGDGLTNLNAGSQPISGTAQYGTTAPSTDPAVVNAGVISQLNGYLGNLDQQQQIGLGNLQNSYNTSANRLDQQNGVAQNQYNTQKQQNTQSYLNNRNNIVTNTNSQANALQRLLGINGSGNSSASYDLVPYAAGLQGSQLINQAQQTYGSNGSALDNGWQQTELNYNNGLQDLNQQLYSGQNGLKSSIAQARANLLSQLASASNDPNAYTGDIQSLTNQITQLGNQYAQPVIRTSDLGYTPATQANYSLGNTSLGYNAPSAGTSDVNPVFTSLLAGQRDQYGNLIQ